MVWVWFKLSLGRISEPLSVPRAPALSSAPLFSSTLPSPKLPLSTPSPFKIPSPKLALSPNALSPPPDPFLAPLTLPLTFETSPSISTPVFLSVSHASSALPLAMLSPSLALGDLELKSTPALLLDSDTVSLSSPKRPPLSSSDIVPLLPLPLKYHPSVPVSPQSSTIVTPPGLLRLSPNGLITPPLPNPLGVTPVCSTSSSPDLAPITNTPHPLLSIPLAYDPLPAPPTSLIHVSPFPFELPLSSSGKTYFDILALL
ncbi:hypothetical protein EDB85DRAFT_2157822 [Lactarius pseudohatsudake]|nr:hypothetical protein EDB85DRAFT_2157822 [Lactarius pseudohatsudake]